jgi:hypothetical protein
MVDLIRRHRRRTLGKYGISAEKLSMNKNEVRKQQYSVSLLSAISYDRVIANQLIEGGVDSTVFENFLQQMLLGISGDHQL